MKPGTVEVLSFLRSVLPNHAADDLPLTATTFVMHPIDRAVMRYLARQAISAAHRELLDVCGTLYGIELCAHIAVPEGQVVVQNRAGDVLGVITLGH